MFIVRRWLLRYFSSDQSIALSLTIVFLAICILKLGSMLSPVFIGIIIAYLLQQPINIASKYLSYNAASIVVFSSFMAIMLALGFIFMPLIFSQIELLSAEFPVMINEIRTSLIGLSQTYPQLLPAESLNKLLTFMYTSSEDLLHEVIKFIIKGIPSALTFTIDLILIPLIVFFLNKDKDYLGSLVSLLYPSKRDSLMLILDEVNQQLGNYIRGKVLQMMIVTLLCLIVFKSFSVHYALLFSLAIGVSVFIPYVGATLTTVPFIIVAYGQFGGFSSTFWQLMICFQAVQALDGNIIVPLIFSEAVSLHPLLIIFAIIFFGGIWGVLGVFFSIPLASVIKALIMYWPLAEVDQHASIQNNG